MLGDLPTILRLSLCLLFSVSAHGGVAFYEWASSPAEPSLAHAPVVVSLLQVAEVPAAVSTNKPRQQQLPVPAARKLPAAKAAQPVPVPKLAASPSPKASSKALPKKAALPKETVRPKEAMPRVVTEEPQAERPSSEMVCMTPQDVVLEGVSELFADNLPQVASARAAKSQDEAPGSAAQTSEMGLRDSETLSAYRSTLIEAIPKYRNNPLPEYPFLARQRHWQGVVWLVVDVSAEGLVDDVDIERSCGYRVLDRSARKTVQRWQFTPAMRAGLPVESQVRIPVRFSLEES